MLAVRISKSLVDLLYDLLVESRDAERDITPLSSNQHVRTSFYGGII